MKVAKRNAWLLLICFIIYTVSYMGKNAYTTNIQNVITDFKVSKTYAGYVSSAFFFCYGIGQLVNGVLCEKMNSKWTISLALFFSAAITLTMFLLKNILAMAILWGLNGLILSTLWCHCVKLLATIKDDKYISRSATLMSVCVPAGLLPAYGFSALFTFLDNWLLIYLLSGSLLLLSALAFFFLVDKIEKDARAEGEEIVRVEKRKEKEGGKTVFRTFGLSVIPLLVISVCTGIMRDGSSSWMPVLLTETYAMPDFFSILVTLGLPLVGIFTAVLSAWLMNKTKSVMTTCFVAGSVSVLSLGVCALWFRSSVVLLIATFMFLSIACHIFANILTSILPLYYKGELKSGQTAGILNAFIYMGSTLATLFLGSIVESWGWETFIIVLLGCAVLTAGMAALGMFLLRKKDKKVAEKGE